MLVCLLVPDELHPAIWMLDHLACFAWKLATEMILHGEPEICGASGKPFALASAFVTGLANSCSVATTG